MTKKKIFYCLLIVYLIVVGISIFLGNFFDKSIPEGLRESFDKFASNYVTGRGSLHMLLSFIIISITLLFALLGMIGLLFLWNPARYIFLIAVIIKVFFSFLVLRPVMRIPLDETIGTVEVFLDGIILTSIFFTPLRELFQKPKEALK